MKNTGERNPRQCQSDKEHVTTTLFPPNMRFSTLKLTTAEIVEFLKSPLVQGDHRRAFLDLLECRYGHRFGNQWAFVEYAQAENLGLDFTAFTKQPPASNAPTPRRSCKTSARCSIKRPRRCLGQSSHHRSA